jgi:hypothetical protein
LKESFYASREEEKGISTVGAFFEGIFGNGVIKFFSVFGGIPIWAEE